CRGTTQNHTPLTTHPIQSEWGAPLKLRATAPRYGSPIQAPLGSAGMLNTFSFIEILAAPHMQPI
ncbi:hypothetical protein, partial [Ralstonia pseudosolanacearum]|uniref:hypothetical protein n=1 Tax=Ralstonia pseudosolanacearum TaxID=1310165 RepID=UPI003CEF34EE